MFYSACFLFKEEKVLSWKPQNTWRCICAYSEVLVNPKRFIILTQNTETPAALLKGNHSLFSVYIYLRRGVARIRLKATARGNEKVQKQSKKVTTRKRKANCISAKKPVTQKTAWEQTVWTQPYTSAGPCPVFVHLDLFGPVPHRALSRLDSDVCVSAPEVHRPLASRGEHLERSKAGASAESWQTLL